MSTSYYAPRGFYKPSSCRKDEERKENPQISFERNVLDLYTDLSKRYGGVAFVPRNAVNEYMSTFAELVPRLANVDPDFEEIERRRATARGQQVVVTGLKGRDFRATTRWERCKSW